MSRGNVLLEAESFKAVNEEEVTKETKEKSNTENGVYVKGMALPFGETSRNGVQYEKQSVKENADDLVGRTMLFNHKQDWVTGHILNTEITEDGMFFEGDINPNAEMPNGVPVAEAIERGDINSVSIQAFIEQLGEEADEDAVIQDMETEKVAVQDFLEISAVSIPGFPQAEALPEHLQNQGVQPVTEIVGSNKQSNQTETVTESLENPEFEVGDFVEWEFGDGSSQGETIDVETEPGESMSAGGNEFTVDEEDDEPLYKIEEWDETAGDNGEFTNNVVKFEGELSSTDRPEAAEQKQEAPEFDDMGECISFHMDEEDMEQDQAVAVCMDKMSEEDLPEELQTEDKVNEQTFDDYPEAAQENARTALEAKEETGNPNDCGTQVGWERANQLDNGESLSEDTIGRMAAFERHEDNKDQGEEGRADCGWMMWNAWGGDEGIEWAQEKLDEIDEENLSSETKQLLVEHGIMTDEQESGEQTEETKSEQLTEDEMDAVLGTIGGALDAHMDAAMQDIEEELEAMVEEETDMDDEEDDDEDDEEDESQEQLEETIEKQSKKITELEKRLENLLENDEGSSQQQSPSSENSSETEPWFGDVL